MATREVDAHEGDSVSVVSKGAPDVLLALCTHERVGTEVRPLDDDRRKAVLTTVDALADRALRTLAVAYRPVADDGAVGAGADVEHDLTYVGMVGILDPPRAAARVPLAHAPAAGIRVRRLPASPSGAEG